MKRKYLRPTLTTMALPVGELLAGSVRNDDKTIINDGTKSGDLEEGDGEDANAKTNPNTKWGVDSWGKVGWND